MWYFLLKSILSAVIGSQFYKWYASTKIGIWTQKHVDKFMIYLSNKYDIKLLKKDLKFKQDYPLIMERLEKLEDVAHPFDGAHVTDAAVDKTKDLYNLEGLEERVKALENRQNPNLYGNEPDGFLRVEVEKDG